jgi:hypothetical protein
MLQLAFPPCDRGERLPLVGFKRSPHRDVYSQTVTQQQPLFSRGGRLRHAPGPVHAGEQREREPPECDRDALADAVAVAAGEP